MAFDVTLLKSALNSSKYPVRFRTQYGVLYSVEVQHALKCDQNTQHCASISLLIYSVYILYPTAPRPYLT